MDNALAFIANAMWCLLYLAAFIYNIKERSDIRPIVVTALILTVGYAGTQLLTHWTFQGTKPSQQIGFQYLLWSVACLAIAVSIIAYHWVGRYRRFWPINVILALLIVDASANVLMHIDQNLIGLNDGGPANSVWALDYWWGWTAYSMLSNVNSAVYFIVLFLSVGYTGGGMGELLKSIAKDMARIVSVFNFDSKCVYKRLNTVQDMINALPHNHSRRTALDAVNGARELLCRQDETGQSYEQSIAILLNTAAEIAVRADYSVSEVESSPPITAPK